MLSMVTSLAPAAGPLLQGVVSAWNILPPDSPQKQQRMPDRKWGIGSHRVLMAIVRTLAFSLKRETLQCFVQGSDMI